MQQYRTVSKSVNIILALIAILPFIITIRFVSNYSLNLPIYDDWEAILKFMINWSNSSKIQKIILLFSQHNEHRILSSRIVYILYYHFCHRINFVSLIIIANLQLVVIAGIIFYFSQNILKGIGGILAIVISICVFDPSNFENSNFAMAGMQNYGIIMFFLISLYFYSLKSSKYYILFLAVFFQFLCAFSSGNGFMAGLALVVFNLFNMNTLKTKVCITGFIIFTTSYFCNYHSPGPSHVSTNIPIIIYFFLKLSGAHFERDYKLIRILIALVLYTVLVLCLFYKMNKEKYLYKIKDLNLLPLLSLLFFILLSITSLSILRSGGEDGVGKASCSRYFIYPNLLTAIVFIILLLRIQPFKYRWIIISAALLIFINSYRVNYNYGRKGYIKTKTTLTESKYFFYDSTIANKIAIDACSKKIYCIDENRPQ